MAAPHAIGRRSLSYRWRIDSRPGGSHATLMNATCSPRDVRRRQDRHVNGPADRQRRRHRISSVVITVPNSAPIANAGPDRTARRLARPSASRRQRLGEPIATAIGCATWNFVSIPAGSAARQLASRRSIRPSFIVDQAGTYVVALTVNDGTVDSAPARHREQRQLQRRLPT